MATGIIDAKHPTPYEDWQQRVTLDGFQAQQRALMSDEIGGEGESVRSKVYHRLGFLPEAEVELHLIYKPKAEAVEAPLYAEVVSVGVDLIKNGVIVHNYDLEVAYRKPSGELFPRQGFAIEEATALWGSMEALRILFDAEYGSSSALSPDCGDILNPN
jgi:hypothetical protein